MRVEIQKSVRMCACGPGIVLEEEASVAVRRRNPRAVEAYFADGFEGFVDLRCGKHAEEDGAYRYRGERTTEVGIVGTSFLDGIGRDKLDTIRNDGAFRLCSIRMN